VAYHSSTARCVEQSRKAGAALRFLCDRSRVPRLQNTAGEEARLVADIVNISSVVGRTFYPMRPGTTRRYGA
jgi:hypothetical protein